MARKKTASTASTPKRPAAQRTAEAGPAPRQRGHRSIVTKRDLLAYRKRLEGELAELTGQRRDLEEATGASMSEAIGEVGFDEEYADAGTVTFERERDLSLSQNARDLIEKIERALVRMDQGTYGRCQACGRPIEPERLDALPYTTYCLADARRRVRLR